VKVDIHERDLDTLVVATLKDVADTDTLRVAVRIVGRRECAIPCITTAEYLHRVAAGHCKTLARNADDEIKRYLCGGVSSISIRGTVGETRGPLKKIVGHMLKYAVLNIKPTYHH